MWVGLPRDDGPVLRHGHVHGVWLQTTNRIVPPVIALHPDDIRIAIAGMVQSGRWFTVGPLQICFRVQTPRCPGAVSSPVISPGMTASGCAFIELLQRVQQRLGPLLCLRCCLRRQRPTRV